MPEFDRITALLLEAAYGTTDRNSNSGESSSLRPTKIAGLDKDPEDIVAESDPNIGQVLTPRPSDESLSGRKRGPTPGNRKREMEHTNDLEELVKDLRFLLAEEKGRRAELEEIYFKMFNEKLRGLPLE